MEDGRPRDARDLPGRHRTRQLHRELRIRASQQEAVARLGERALTETDLQKFFDDAAATIAEILDVESRNPRLVPGDAELLLRAGVGWKPGLVGVAHVSTDREIAGGFTLARGGPVMVENLPTETRFSGATAPARPRRGQRRHHADRGTDGRAYGVLGAHTASRAIQRV